MNKFVKTISKRKLYTEYLRTINGIVDLTEREIQILGAMMVIQNNLGDTRQIVGSITSTGIRKKMFEDLGITKSNYIGYINTFKKKGLLTNIGDGMYFVNDKLFPVVIGDRVQITIVLKLDETNK